MSQALNLQINSSPVPRRETLGKPCSTGRLEVYCSLSAGWRAKRTKATRTDSEKSRLGHSSARKFGWYARPPRCPCIFFFFFICHFRLLGCRRHLAHHGGGPAVRICLGRNRAWRGLHFGPWDCLSRRRTQRERGRSGTYCCFSPTRVH